jgi:hypothetical protein
VRPVRAHGHEERLATRLVVVDGHGQALDDLGVAVGLSAIYASNLY